MTADEFNAAHPIGTPVLAFPGAREGRAMLTRTRTPAWTIGRHAVVSVEGYAGGIALTHIEIAEESPVTVQPTRDQLLDMTEDLRVLGDRPELCDEVVDGLWAALDRAEHLIARLEAQSGIRGRAVVMYRERAREAETRIRRALEG